MGDFVVIAGLSGAGRSQAANDFEDLGWFVIDNLPPALMPKVTELADAKGSSITRIVLVAGTGHYDRELVDAITELRRSVPRVRILFLDCATPELVRRYEQTRRRHPIHGHTIEEAIAAERRILEPVRAEADVVIDTTELNVHQLRDRVRAAFGDEESDVGMVTTIRSFGFKHGAPIDADIVLDVRFLPNPHWVDELRPLTGLDEPVRAEADVVVDTTELNVHQLRDRVRAAFGDEETDVGMVTTIRSFGFKHGAPIDADIVLDVRFLPNPHWVDELRPLTGLDAPVRDYVLEQEAAKAFVDKVVDLLELTLPAYKEEGKAYLSIAIGCTGGRHRSVAIAEEIAARLAEDGTVAAVAHRDVER